MKLPTGKFRLALPTPKPSFRNILPAGEGWYEFKWLHMEWQRIENATLDSIWLSNDNLMDFAIDALDDLMNDS